MIVNPDGMWISIIAKKTKTSEKRKKQQPTENQRILNIKI